MTDGSEGTSDVDRLRLPGSGSGTSATGASYGAWPDSDEWDEFDSKVAARPLPGGLGNEDVFCTDYGGGFVGMSFRFYDPETRRWSIYWADSRRPGLLDPPVVGSFSGDIGRLRGRGHVRRTPDPRPLHLVGRDDADAALGAGLLRRRRQRPGRRTGSWTSRARSRRRHDARSSTPPSVAPEYRHVEKLVSPSRASRSTAPSSSGTTIAPDDDAGSAGDQGAGATQLAGRVADRERSESLGELGFVRPASLRRGLLLPPRVHVAQRERALGDGVGEGRRQPTSSSGRGRSRARTVRRSASGSSEPSVTNERRGASTCARERDERSANAYLRSSYEGVV